MEKKNIKVRDLKPSKDAKGGGARGNTGHLNTGHLNSGRSNTGHQNTGHQNSKQHQHGGGGGHT